METRCTALPAHRARRLGPGRAPAARRRRRHDLRPVVRAGRRGRLPGGAGRAALGRVPRDPHPPPGPAGDQRPVRAPRGARRRHRPRPRPGADIVLGRGRQERQHSDLAGVRRRGARPRADHPEPGPRLLAAAGPRARARGVVRGGGRRPHPRRHRPAAGRAAHRPARARRTGRGVRRRHAVDTSAPGQRVTRRARGRGGPAAQRAARRAAQPAAVRLGGRVRPRPAHAPDRHRTHRAARRAPPVGAWAGGAAGRRGPQRRVRRGGRPRRPRPTSVRGTRAGRGDRERAARGGDGGAAGHLRVARPGPVAARRRPDAVAAAAPATRATRALRSVGFLMRRKGAELADRNEVASAAMGVYLTALRQRSGPRRPR